MFYLVHQTNVLKGMENAKTIYYRHEIRIKLTTFISENVKLSNGTETGDKRMDETDKQIIKNSERRFKSRLRRHRQQSWLIRRRNTKKNQNPYR